DDRLEFPRVAAAKWRRRPSPSLSAPPLPVTVWVSLLPLAVLLGVLLLTSGTAANQLPAAILDAVVDGWAKLLDVTLPAPADRALLPVPVVLTWLAAAAAAEVVARTQAVLLPALPPLLAFRVSPALGVSGNGS